MTTAYDYPLLDVFWTMLEFFLLFIWIMLLFNVFGDLFRRHDMGGAAKALWLLVLLVLPFLGVFIYLVANGSTMGQRAAVTLRDVQGWTAEEVSEALGVSRGNQRVLLHRARSRLRTALEEWMQAPRKALA